MDNKMLIDISVSDKNNGNTNENYLIKICIGKKESFELALELIIIINHSNVFWEYIP